MYEQVAEDTQQQSLAFKLCRRRKFLSKAPSLAAWFTFDGDMTGDASSHDKVGVRSGQVGTQLKS
jgi:hypothetical protein